MTINLDEKIRELDSDFNPSDESILKESSFTWRDALLQNTWGFCVFPTEYQRLNIMRVAHKLSLIKKLFPVSDIQIHSWFRCRPYNVHIGGSKMSAHIDGEAVDFSVPGIHSSIIRARLSNHLDNLGIRVERLHDAANWVHCDIRNPGLSGRYFTP